MAIDVNNKTEGMNPELVFMGLAAFGGVVKHLNEYLKGKKFSFQKLLANVMVAAFSGFMFALAYRNLQPNGGDMLYVCAGIGGYLGPAAIELVIGILIKMLRQSLPESPYNEQKKSPDTETD